MKLFFQAVALEILGRTPLVQAVQEAGHSLVRSKHCRALTHGVSEASVSFFQPSTLVTSYKGRRRSLLFPSLDASTDVFQSPQARLARQLAARANTITC